MQINDALVTETIRSLTPAARPADIPTAVLIAALGGTVAGLNAKTSPGGHTRTVAGLVQVYLHEFAPRNATFADPVDGAVVTWESDGLVVADVIGTHLDPNDGIDGLERQRILRVAEKLIATHGQAAAGVRYCHLTAPGQSLYLQAGTQNPHRLADSDQWTGGTLRSRDEIVGLVGGGA